MSRTPRPTVRPARAALLAAALGSALAACGPSLDTRVMQAMDGCVKVRAPLFDAMRRDEGAALPQPPEVEAVARSLDYQRAADKFMEIGDAAATRAILTCSMDLAARHRSARVRKWLDKYTRSQAPEIAAAATRLIARYQDGQG